MSALAGCFLQMATLKAQTPGQCARGKEVAAAADCDTAMAAASDDEDSDRRESYFLHPHRSVHPTSLGKEIVLPVP